MIQTEGVASLTDAELLSACSTRGIRTAGVTKERLQLELAQWLELNLVHKIPSGILILSKAMMMTDRPVTTQEALQATLSSLPEALVDEAEAQTAEGTLLEDNWKKLEVLKAQEYKIAEEKEQGPAIKGENDYSEGEDEESTVEVISEEAIKQREEELYAIRDRLKEELKIAREREIREEQIKEKES